MNNNDLEFIRSFLVSAEVKLKLISEKAILVATADSLYRKGPGQWLVPKEDLIYILFPRLLRKAIYHAGLFVLKMGQMVNNDVNLIIHDPSLELGAASSMPIDETIYFDFDSFVLDIKRAFETNINTKVLEALHLEIRPEFRKYSEEIRLGFISKFVKIMRDEEIHSNNFGISMAQTVNAVKIEGKIHLIFPSYFEDDVIHLFVESFNGFYEAAERYLVFLMQSKHKTNNQELPMKVPFQGKIFEVPSLIVSESENQID